MAGTQVTRNLPPLLGVARDVQPSRQASRYVLGDLLGRGGMAEVFAGHSHGDHGFAKPVAIKRLLPELATDVVFVERLIAEAKLLLGMTHGNIVSVIDLARDGQNVVLVMDYVDGPSLRGLIRARGNGPLSLGLASYVIQSAAAGLEFAHARKGGAVIHADISPSNLLLTTSGEVRVADFGIAREQGHCDGLVEGKWAYMAPEQARGEALTPASDVFALGVCLYELITGQHPFAHQTTEKAREKSPIVIARPTAIAPHIPPGLEAIAMKALALDPRARYQRMQHVIDALVDERFSNKWRDGAKELAQLIAASMPPGTPGGADPSRAGTHVTSAPVQIVTSSLLALELPSKFARSRSALPIHTAPAIPRRMPLGTPNPDDPDPFGDSALSDIVTNELSLYSSLSRSRSKSVPPAAATDETREAVLLDPSLLDPPAMPAALAAIPPQLQPGPQLPRFSAAPRSPTIAHDELASVHGGTLASSAGITALSAPRMTRWAVLILIVATVAGIGAAITLRGDNATAAAPPATPIAPAPTPITTDLGVAITATPIDEAPTPTPAPSAQPADELPSLVEITSRKTVKADKRVVNTGAVVIRALPTGFVSVDGGAKRAAPTTLRLSPGKHSIRIFTAEQSRVRQVDVASNTTQFLTMDWDSDELRSSTD